MSCRKRVIAKWNGSLYDPFRVFLHTYIEMAYLIKRAPLENATRKTTMYEVILYAAIATIVCVILYSVLGKSIGQGPEAGYDPTKTLSGQSDAPKVIEPVFDDKGLPGLAAIAAGDPNFSEKQFIDGAKAAYSMILEGFADGDREGLQALLMPDVYTVYAEAIAAREAAEHRQVTDLGRLIDAKIVDASKTGKIGQISVEFEAELTSALLDNEGNLVQGDPDVLSRVIEVWTFERKLSSQNPNWMLSDVAPSEGDDLVADPTPDTKSD